MAKTAKYDFKAVETWQERFAQEEESKKKIVPRYLDARLENGFTRMEIADILDVSEMTVYSWENGLKAPRMTQLIRLSRIYGKTTDYLIGL